MDSTEGRFYSDWICFLYRDDIIIHHRGIRHIRPEYVLRRRPEKRNLEAFALFMVFLESSVVVVLVSDYGKNVVEIALFIILLVNIVVICYYAGYGLRKKWYNHVLAAVACAPLAFVMYLTSPVCFVIAVYVMYIPLISVLIQMMSGWVLDCSEQDLYYQYDPYEEK
ncbi:MAG: hypothetical protein IKN41_04060 [Candidatus Methanomethylophilaceae archaeon]|nr:hypothetical protein [Candidatus Methanomethylophilaceae archaeon]